VLTQLKNIARRLPLVPRLYRWYSRLNFNDSQSYWEQRYQSGGNSGAGSYGRLAQFKAEVLNDFVREHNIDSVIEFGSGDGHQLSLAQYPSYTGLDVSQRAIDLCRQRFDGDDAKRFVHYNPVMHDSAVTDENGTPLEADLSLSLDVIYHLVEDKVFDTYMRHLFAAGRRFVIVYSSNDPEACLTAAHVRHRRFTDWVEAHAPQWRFQERIANRFPFDASDADETSFADFYIFEHVDG